MSNISQFFYKREEKEEMDSNAMGLISWKSLSITVIELLAPSIFFDAFLHFPDFLEYTCITLII